MRMVLSSDAADPIVGREYVDEDPEGEFLLVPSGAIMYRHRSVGEMLANASRTEFLECVRAWERYIARVVTVHEEAEQLRVVDELRRDLARQDALHENGFWTSILEQAGWGHLEPAQPPLQRAGASLAALPLAPAAERQYRSADRRHDVAQPRGNTPSHRSCRF